MFRLFKEFKSLWYEDAVKRKLATPFIMFVFFLGTFIASRIVAYYLPGINRAYSPYHIHHFFYGILALIISNWISLVGKGRRLMWVAAAIFGAGLGAIFDEIGMMIICGTPGTVCDPDILYWARFNYDIIMYVVIGFLLILYFRPFWLMFKRKILGIFYQPWGIYRKVERKIKKKHKQFKKEIKKRF
jgi:hypothetical protein